MYEKGSAGALRLQLQGRFCNVNVPPTSIFGHPPVRYQPRFTSMCDPIRLKVAMSLLGVVLLAGPPAHAQSSDEHDHFWKSLTNNQTR